MSVSVCACVLSHTQEDAEFLLARIFALRDEAQALSDALESEHLSRGAHDHLRDLHKEATRQLALAVQKRRSFERSAAFARYESLRSLRTTAATQQKVLAAAEVADRLTEGVNHFSAKPVKREAPSCGVQAARRPLVACNTLARTYTAAPESKRRRYTPTPHPRKGVDAVRDSGGAVQALIDSPTPRGTSFDEEEEVAEGEAVFSFDEEDGYAFGSD